MGAPVQAYDQVVLLQDPSSAGETGLAAALRIQLRGVAELKQRTGPASGSLPARVHDASALAEREDALLVVWVDEEVDGQTAVGAREAVLYLVGRHRSRALLDVIRVPAGDGPALERSMALKVREVVDGLLRARQQVEPNPLLEEPMHSAGPWVFDMGLHAAVGVAPMSDTRAGQWAIQAALHTALQRSSHRFELEVAGLFAPDAALASSEQHASVRELAPVLSGAYLRDGDGAWLGLRTGLAFGSVRVQGLTLDGRRGSAHELAPAWHILGELRLPLGTSAWIDLRVGLEARLVRRRFTIDGDEAVDLGLLRPSAWLGFGYARPMR